MVFLPGDHTLDTNITVANVARLTMHGESSSDSMATVVCNGSVGFLFSNMERFIIHSLAFTTCSRTYTIEALDIASLISLPVLDSTQYNFSIPIKYALLLQSTQCAELVNCSFHDNLGTALVVNNTNITLSGNTEFTHNYCESTSCVGGGGIAAIGSNLTFTGDTMFIGNEANFGGAGIFMINSTMSSTGSIHFIRNSISGNITIPEIRTFRLAAGIICASESSLHFNGTSNFINNSAQSLTVITAGAICAVNNVSLSFTGINNFTNNSAQYGGAIFGYFNTSLGFSGINNFTNNSARYYGGAIFGYVNTSLSFSGTNNFINNSAWYGGAIYVYNNSALSCTGTNNFTNNSAQYEGGAITGYVNTSLSFSGTNNFINNSASSSWGSGGAIRVSNNLRLSFVGVTNFERNSATRGGGIYASYNSVLNISGTSNFSSNSAVQGGAIFLNNDITLTFDGVIHFTSNRHNTEVSSNGGAMFLDVTSAFIILPNTTVYWVKHSLLKLSTC